TLQLPARWVKNASCIGADQRTAWHVLRLTGLTCSCSPSPSRPSSSSNMLPPVPERLSGRQRSGCSPRPLRPDSQFFSVPVMYPKSVTISSVLYLYGYIRRSSRAPLLSAGRVEAASIIVSVGHRPPCPAPSLEEDGRATRREVLAPIRRAR